MQGISTFFCLFLAILKEKMLIIFVKFHIYVKLLVSMKKLRQSQHFLYFL